MNPPFFASPAAGAGPEEMARKGRPVDVLQLGGPRALLHGGVLLHPGLAAGPLPGRDGRPGRRRHLHPFALPPHGMVRPKEVDRRRHHLRRDGDRRDLLPAPLPIAPRAGRLPMDATRMGRHPPLRHRPRPAGRQVSYPGPPVDRREAAFHAHQLQLLPESLLLALCELPCSSGRNRPPLRIADGSCRSRSYCRGPQ